MNSVGDSDFWWICSSKLVKPLFLSSAVNCCCKYVRPLPCCHISLRRTIWTNLLCLWVGGRRGWYSGVLGWVSALWDGVRALRKGRSKKKIVKKVMALKNCCSVEYVTYETNYKWRIDLSVCHSSHNIGDWCGNIGEWFIHCVCHMLSASKRRETTQELKETRVVSHGWRFLLVRFRFLES